MLQSWVKVISWPEAEAPELPVSLWILSPDVLREADEPGGADTFLGDTDPVEVTADYDAQVSYQLASEPDATFVVVFTRGESNNEFLKTDRFDFQ